jgi:hypothetical protein
MAPLPLGILASSGTGPPTEVAVLSGANPSPATLTGGVTAVTVAGTGTVNYTLGADYLRVAFPAWSDGYVETNKTYNLSGVTRYVADVATPGINDPYGEFFIQYQDSSGNYVTPYSYPRSAARAIYNVNLSGYDAPGSNSKIRFRGSNGFGDAYTYSLIFYYD